MVRGQFFQVSEEILRIRTGKPLETGAVLPEYHGHPTEAVNISPVLPDPEDPHSFTIALEPDDVVFGLGENMRGMNKRGGIYDSWCSDEKRHTPEKRSLYGAYNFLLLDGGRPDRCLGIFVDFPGMVTFDVGFSVDTLLSVRVARPDYDLYLIRCGSVAAAARSFRRIIGRPYIPPKWAFGYIQSRWGYDDAATVEAVGRRFREEDIPCDAICLDIEYMDGYKDFTVHPERFPDFPAHVARMLDMGFRLVPIIDAGVKVETGYGIYEEGIAKGMFCTADNGEPFSAAVWPGQCHFPDFLNPDVRRWFGSRYRGLVNAGIEGFWNDMNEPALFYTDEGMKRAMDHARRLEGRNLAADDFFALTDAFAFDDRETDFRRFYHTLQDGRRVNHGEVHNLYGYNMTRAAAEGLKKIDPGRRFLLFSRSGYIGMHRYAGIWTGDNSSWWEHLLLNLKMLPALGMCGFLYSGADLGGHMHHANGQLVSRWTQFGVFTPLMRNHSPRDVRQQDPFAFDEETTDHIRRAIQFRYALIPWIFAEFARAAAEDEALFAPLAFQFDDPRSRRVEDQLLMGRSLMLAPVYEENALGRFLWAPEELLLWKVRDYKTKEFAVLARGDHWLDIGPDEIPVLLRPDSVLVLGGHAACVEELDHSSLEAIIFFTGQELEYDLYWEEGGEPGSLIFHLQQGGQGPSLSVSLRGKCPVREIRAWIVDAGGGILRKRVAVLPV